MNSLSEDLELHPFHLALPVHDLTAARAFYGDRLGCIEGRSAERWIDYDFFGHQLSVHLVDEDKAISTNSVDGDQVPARHFGVVLPWTEWQALQARFDTFLIEPKVRFQGEVGEQGTFFVHDSSGNALEFKSFRDPSRLFAR
jgi:extradiol dioxygenase family protein